MTNDIKNTTNNPYSMFKFDSAYLTPAQSKQSVISQKPAAMADKADEFIKESPKSKSSKREIPLPKQILPLLKDLNRKRDSNFIVSTAGCGVSVRSYQRSFYLLLKKLNIERRGFHTIRHTFATRALECGMDVKTLAELLGHKSPTTTLNRYAHSFIEHKRDMMNRLGKLL